MDESRAHLDRLRRDQLPADTRAIADALDELLLREHGIIAGHHAVGHFLDLLADRGYTITATHRYLTEPEPEPALCLEWQQTSAGYNLVGPRRYCLKPLPHDDHDFQPVPPPIIHSHDPDTGTIDLEHLPGRRVLVKRSPGPIVGFTVALYAPDGPHFVYDPEADGQWRGPLTTSEASIARDHLQKPWMKPPKQPSSEEWGA